MVRFMKIKMCIIFVLGAFLLNGCTMEKENDKKIKDIEFTVLDPEDAPKELKDMIKEEKEQPFKLTLGEDGFLYIAEGYGKQASSGYSIEVTEVYEAENAIYIKTNLLGPEKGEKVTKKATYPYVVVKIEYNEKHVVFM